jgi:hypothetical protein
MDETMSNADQLAIGLWMRMGIMHARQLPTREERRRFLANDVAQGPHGGRAQMSQEAIDYVLDRLDAEVRK